MHGSDEDGHLSVHKQWFLCISCYLDASKAFDRVDHSLLFQKLEERGLPPAILNFLLSWYHTQQMKVQWDLMSTSDSFTVTNGVRQVVYCLLSYCCLPG